jgi:X-X-X-Leu-X-X-Gly heptad repeat protein
MHCTTLHNSHINTYSIKLCLLLGASLVLFALTAQAPAHAQFRQVSRRDLPPCRMDSFVDQAGGMAELIYGDEGEVGLPPYDNFTKEHRINAGIFGVRDAGLTTGHGSFMPDAWGADEYIGDEWGQSGSQYGNYAQQFDAYGNPIANFVNNGINTINNGVNAVNNGLNAVNNGVNQVSNFADNPP